MAAKIKYPVRAALARFIPIDNHLTNMVGFLEQVRLFDLALRVMDIQIVVRKLDEDIKPFREK